MYLIRFDHRRVSALGIAAGVLVVLTLMAGQTAGGAIGPRLGPTGSAAAGAASTIAGTEVTAKTYARQPPMTASDRAGVQVGMTLRPGPRFPVYRGSVPKPAGPETLPPSVDGSSAPGN